MEQKISKFKIFTTKVGNGLKEHSPEILLVAGVGGFIYSTYLACKATTKVSEILKDTEEQLKAVDDVLDSPAYMDTYTEETADNDRKIIKTKSIVAIVKAYAPSIIVGTLSAIAVFSSNDIMRKRNLGLAAAYATLDTGFREYRQRVVDRFGEDIDKELRYNMHDVKISETVEDEDGKKKKVKKTVKVVDPNLNSMYAVYFDDTCKGWTDDPERNRMQLRAIQNTADYQLKAYGVLLLNDVYKMLGYPQTIAGRHVGWVMKDDFYAGPSEDDGFVDFGIMDVIRETSDPDNPYKECILLDFNVRQIEDEEYIKLINGGY